MEANHSKDLLILSGVNVNQKGSPIATRKSALLRMPVPSQALFARMSPYIFLNCLKLRTSIAEKDRNEKLSKANDRYTHPVINV